MECLRNLLKDYKNEIDEMLVADKQLQKELIYDIQKYESLRAKTTAAEAVGKGVNGNSAIATSKVTSSAVAGVLAEATARSVLRDVNQGAGTPSLSAMSVPKLKSTTAGASKHKGRSAAVIPTVAPVEVRRSRSDGRDGQRTTGYRDGEEGGRDVEGFLEVVGTLFITHRNSFYLQNCHRI